MSGKIEQANDLPPVAGLFGFLGLFRLSRGCIGPLREISGQLFGRMLYSDTMVGSVCFYLLCFSTSGIVTCSPSRAQKEYR